MGCSFSVGFGLGDGDFYSFYFYFLLLALADSFPNVFSVSVLDSSAYDSIFLLTLFS